MGRRKTDIKDQILHAVKQGRQTVSKIAGYLCISKSIVTKACAEILIEGKLDAKRSRGITYYSLVQSGNYHDPFSLCGLRRNSARTRGTEPSVLQGEAKSGFGQRTAHRIADDRESDTPSCGDGSRHAYKYGKPTKLSDIV